MKTREAVVLLAVIGALGAGAQTAATSSSTRDFGLVGLGSTETAQLFVINTAAAASSGTAASCVGSLSFTNAAGTAIGTAVNFTVGTGQSSSITLPYAQAGQSGRAEVRAHLTLTRTAGTNPPCALRTVFETFDTTTGATHIHIDGAAEVYGGGGRN